MTRDEQLLACLAEECMEVGQLCMQVGIRASKALRFGLDEVKAGQPLDNAAKIVAELADLKGVLELLEESGAIPRSAVDRKKAKVERFILYADWFRGWLAANPEADPGDPSATTDRDALGRVVKLAAERWVRSLPEQPSELVPSYDGLSEEERESCRQVGEAVRDHLTIVDPMGPDSDPSSPVPLRIGSDETRDFLGRVVRDAWVRWASVQPASKPSWLVRYDDLAEPDREAHRLMGEAVLDAANVRRIYLANKMAKHTVTVAEREEFRTLQERYFGVIDAMNPRKPDPDLARIERDIALDACGYPPDDEETES